MAFYHVGACDCPVGCCDCGEDVPRKTLTEQITDSLNEALRTVKEIEENKKKQDKHYQDIDKKHKKEEKRISSLDNSLLETQNKKLKEENAALVKENKEIIKDLEHYRKCLLTMLSHTKNVSAAKMSRLKEYFNELEIEDMNDAISMILKSKDNED